MSQPSIGLLFPGQGSQFVGMGQDLAERFPEAEATFAEADEALGFGLSRLCKEGPQSELVRTRNAQPAILVHSLAVWRLVRDLLPRVAMGAGHSLGELSTYAAAGSLEFVDAVRLVRLRGMLMSEAGRQRAGTMAAILGLDDTEVERVCREASSEHGVVVAANFNAPGQVVVSGDSDAVQRATEAARTAGARRVLPLSVSGAFHSPLMEPAVAGYAEHIRSAAFHDPAFPVVSNVTSRPVRDAEDARERLIEQLIAPVRWTASVRAMAEAGIMDYFELGPGSVLAGLMKRIAPGARARSLGTAEQVEQFLSEGGTTWN
jgi:[acyl-carrier-protein] S-malonyltransferase